LLVLLVKVSYNIILFSVTIFHPTSERDYLMLSAFELNQGFYLVQNNSSVHQFSHLGNTLLEDDTYIIMT